MKTRIVLAAAILCLPIVGRADDPEPKKSIQSHANRQEKRIEKGEKSGRLNAGEAAKMDTKEQAIQNERAAAGADGKVTKRERSSIHHEQKEASRDIHRMKHNKKNAPNS